MLPYIIIYTKSLHIPFYICLLYEYLFQPMLGQHASMPRKGKGFRHIGWNTQPHPRQMMRSQGMKSRMENRREQKEINREQVPNPATLDHSVTSYDVPILFNPWLIYIYIYPSIYILLLWRSNPSRQHSNVLYCWGQNRRKDRKTQQSKSGEKVVGFSSASLFPAMKGEAVTHGGAI